MQTVALRNNVEMPRIGFGTWKLQEGEECYSAVRKALDTGYRLIDTAAYYGNEHSVGKAIRESGIPRDQVFVTTKLWPTDFLHPRSAFEKSRDLLDVGAVDLYLVHWPVPAMPRSVWQELESIADEGSARAIGVSNYGIGDIERLLEYARIPPAVNQIKFSPFDFADEILACCTAHDIVVEAYSPLTRGASLSQQSLVDIAKKHGKSPAQIMLRWCLQHGTVPLPKTSHPDRMKENLSIFDFALDENDMQALNQLS
jgi:diketogulonate reductase-like aldo/keto reductase